MVQVKESDIVIFGAGIYGLYFAQQCAQKHPHKKILILELDSGPVSRASYVNQARVHNGYHYPRSLSTALASAQYYEKFSRDFDFAINGRFEKIYGISKFYSYTSEKNFIAFCKAAGIPVAEISGSEYFKSHYIDGCFKTTETSFDAQLIRSYFEKEIKDLKNIEVLYNTKINSVTKGNRFQLKSDNIEIKTDYIFNATYASINQVLNLFEYELVDIKYELAEICLYKPCIELENIGLTIMDGPFFSAMPFGKSGFHSLSSVHYTPHMSTNEKLPKFECQKNNTNCSEYQLDNCNNCSFKPQSAWLQMYQLAKKYLQNHLEFHYHRSLFAIKAILKSSEIDDSRPTLVISPPETSQFVSVLSGKINTIYDIDKVIHEL